MCTRYQNCYLRIGRVFKLLKNIGIRCLCQYLFSFLNSPLHALGWICENQFSPKSSENYSSLKTHRSRHCNDELITLSCRHKCQPYASITTGRLNEDTLQTSFRHQIFLSTEIQQITYPDNFSFTISRLASV